MSKFLRLCEEFDPDSIKSDSSPLISFLNSKGIHAEPVEGTDMVYIYDGDHKFTLTISSNEEDNINVSTVPQTFELDKLISQLASSEKSGMTGMFSNYMSGASDAKKYLKDKDKLVKKAIPAMRERLKAVEDEIKNMNSSSPASVKFS
jgi:hypothetical protein